MPSETIYVPLLDEGTDVWRPVEAERLSDGTFRVLGVMPEDEDWAYKPGQIVAVADRVLPGGMKGLVADRLAIEVSLPLHDWADVEQSIAETICSQRRLVQSIDAFKRSGPLEPNSHALSHSQGRRSGILGDNLPVVGEGRSRNLR